MRYRVAFSKRTQSDGQASAIDPTATLDAYLTEGVVAEKIFVERLESAAQHSQEVLDEDDAFLAASTPEAWDYEVVDAREDEFIDAMRRSQVVINFAVIDDTQTSRDDATGEPVRDDLTTDDRTQTDSQLESSSLEELSVRDADDPTLGLAASEDSEAAEVQPSHPPRKPVAKAKAKARKKPAAAKK